MDTLDLTQGRALGPRVERVRHALKIRSLTVTDVGRVTPGMVRVTLFGEDLADFRSLAFDDHVKIMVPTPSGVERRDYTPRRHDARARTLAIDFAVHDAGPATRWALDARPGDTLQVGGPKGSKVVTGDDVRRWLLVGDETALPAIGRRIEEAGAGDRLTSAVAVAGPAEAQAFATDADLTALWAHRPLAAAADPAALLSALDTLDLRPDTFVWIAAEAGVARAVRDHLVAGRGHPRAWVKAGGYWVTGRSDAHERIE